MVHPIPPQPRCRLTPGRPHPAVPRTPRPAHPVVPAHPASRAPLRPAHPDVPRTPRPAHPGGRDLSEYQNSEHPRAMASNGAPSVRKWGAAGGEPGRAENATPLRKEARHVRCARQRGGTPSPPVDQPTGPRAEKPGHASCTQQGGDTRDASRRPPARVRHRAGAGREGIFRYLPEFDIGTEIGRWVRYGKPEEREGAVRPSSWNSACSASHRRVPGGRARTGPPKLRELRLY